MRVQQSNHAFHLFRNVKCRDSEAVLPFITLSSATDIIQRKSDPTLLICLERSRKFIVSRWERRGKRGISRRWTPTACNTKAGYQTSILFTWNWNNWGSPLFIPQQQNKTKTHTSHQFQNCLGIPRDFQQLFTGIWIIVLMEDSAMLRLPPEDEGTIQNAVGLLIPSQFKS